jgi:hypothetical protein
MNDYDTLLYSMSAIAEQMQGLQAVAVVQYTPVVETISGNILNWKRVEYDRQTESSQNNADVL